MPIQKCLFGLLLLLVFASTAHAITLTQHIIQIDVDMEGYGNVTERFVFLFNSENELMQFRSQAQNLGADLYSWRSYNPDITNSIGDIKPGTGSIGYEEAEGDRQVKLEYQTAQPLFTQTPTNSRETTFTIDSRAFESFRQGSVYVIPSNTKIIISLPSRASIDLESLKPSIENQEILQQIQNDKHIYLSGHLSISGNIGLQYIIEKQIAPTVTLTQVLQEMIRKGEASIIAAVILVLLGITYFKRKSIQDKLETFLADNSKLEHEEETEEIEIDA